MGACGAAALSKSRPIVYQSARRESNPGPAPYKRAALPLSYGPVGSLGLEPTPPRLKGVYAAITPRPRTEGARAFVPVEVCHRVAPRLRGPVGREALESSSAGFQAAASPSQLPTQKEKARHPVS